MFHGSTSDFYRTQFSEAECSINLKLTSQRDNRSVFSTSRDGFFEVSADLQHQQISQDHGLILGKAANFHQTQFELEHSKYLTPTQELLSEFCNLGANQQTHPILKQKSLKINQWNDETRKQSLINSLDLVELQKRKAELLSMLKEVDQRYKMYCDQIKAVVTSFETMVGEGAATVYSIPASKAMSRHFRCLRDGIMGQIKDIKQAMGEENHDEALVTEGNSTNNKTPRLRLLDQSLRKQKCFQQMSIAERQPWRPQRGLPERSVSVLRAWLFEHFLHPYPSDVDKLILARQAGLSRSQVSNWFINARVRLWKPMVEEMYLEETKEQQQQHNMASTATTVGDDHIAANDQKHMIMHSPANHDQDHHQINKPPTNYNQFVRLHHSADSILSSIINITDQSAADDHTIPAGIDLDRLSTPSYSHHTAHHEDMLIPYANNNDIHENHRNGVSLTLGLQQHGNLMSQQHHSFLFPKDHVVEDCQPVQYSV